MSEASTRWCVWQCYWSEVVRSEVVRSEVERRRTPPGPAVGFGTHLRHLAMSVSPTALLAFCGSRSVYEPLRY